MIKKLFILMLISISSYAELSETDLRFLDYSDKLIKENLEKNQQNLLFNGSDVTEYIQVSEKISNEISEKTKQSLLDDSFSMENYKQIINSTYNENINTIEDDNVKQSTSKSQSSTNNSFTCVCASSLSSAFQGINQHLFDDNLEPLGESLDNLISEIENSIKQIEKNKKKLNMELIKLKLLLVKTDEYLFNLKQLTIIDKE